MNTATATAWWVQHAERQGTAWVEHYWEDWQAPHRGYILGALSLLGPITSVYEIGCNAGPNLRLLSQHMPDVELAGQELCKEAAEWAESHLCVPVSVGTLPDCLLSEPDQSVDVALSCYTLAYLDTPDAAETVAHLTRMARKAIVLLEPMPMSTLQPGPCRFDGLPEWRHDYEGLLPGWRLTWKWPIVPSVQNLNGLAIYQPL